MITSIVSGRIISKIGKYRVFPIVGMAFASIGMWLLSRLQIATDVRVMYCYMALLGFGLGMVMQVLVLAAQNAAELKHLGVVTSGVAMFRSVGGSVGVAAFGAIFSNGLHSRLAKLLSDDVQLPPTLDPVRIRQLPHAVYDTYLSAFAGSLHTVYLSAALVIMLAFAMAWWLTDIPLRPHRAEDAPFSE